MTPREPDRFDKQAREILAADDWKFHERIAAALRAEHASALERAAQRYLEMARGAISREASERCRATAEALRSLIPPAAAPAAETGKEQAWAAAIEYCEEMFSPEWLTDPKNRSIFAAHIYRLLNAARAAPPEREGK